MTRRWMVPAVLLGCWTAGCSERKPEGGQAPAEVEAKRADMPPEALPADSGATARERVAAAADKVGVDAGELGAAVDETAANLKGALGDVIPSVGGEKGPPIDAATYRKLLLDVASCEVRDENIDPACEALKALNEGTARGIDFGSDKGGRATLGRELVAHASPAVRIKAAGLMRSLFGTAEESQNAVVDAASKEQHPAVLKALIATVANDGLKNPRVAELLMTASRHEAPMVRRSAIHGLSSTWNRGLEGGTRRLIELMQQDTDARVRQDACKYAGKLGDERLVPAYAKLVRDADAKLAGACLEGLVEMWWSFPFHENASEGAYRLTLAELKRKPRDNDRPSWTVPGNFEHRAKDTFAAWEKKATWFRQKDLNAALLDLVRDGDANWMGRNAAVRSLAAAGVTKAELEAARKAYAEPKGPDSHVVKAIDEAIARLP